MPGVHYAYVYHAQVRQPADSWLSPSVIRGTGLGRANEEDGNGGEQLHPPSAANTCASTALPESRLTGGEDQFEYVLFTKIKRPGLNTTTNILVKLT